MIYSGVFDKYPKLKVLFVHIESKPGHADEPAPSAATALRLAARGAILYEATLIASSDHFSTHISFALVYTDDPTRKGILDAIRKRHTYGATDNIVLDVRMGDHFMGDEFPLQ